MSLQSPSVLHQQGLPSRVNRQSWIMNWALASLMCTLYSSCLNYREIQIEEIAHYNTSGWAHDVNLDERELYVSDRQGGYLVFDRGSDWSAPRMHKPVQDVISLAPHLGRPLLAARFEGLVLASPRGNPVARLANGDIANAVVTRGNLAYAAYGSHGLVVSRVGALALSIVAELPTPGWSHDVKLWGNRALLADWNYGLRVVDVSIPEGPAEIGVLPTPATAICIAVGTLGGRPAAAVAEGHAGVSLVDFDMAGRPSLITRHALGLNPSALPHPEAGGWAHGVALCNNYLFVANWKRGLAILDVLDPRQPRTLMELPTRGTSLGVKAEPGPNDTILVFLADGEEGLRIFRFKGRKQELEVRSWKGKG
jgi:hypothetical protein